MVLRHFNLREQPFGVTPDPRYLYSSGTHREALSALLYGIESGLGFVVLTANPGMGKTTLVFEVLRRLNETAKTVFLFQTISTPDDLFRALLIDLGIENPQGTLVDHQTQLNRILVSQSATGKRLVIFVDEAQNLDHPVLEAVRMLSNFETGHKKLMHIVLSGQLQLAERLIAPELMQLRQRISIFAHLTPLSIAETADYIHHRLKIAGWNSDRRLFTPAATAMIAQESQGIPRNINNICFNALSVACALKRTAIECDVIREVLADLDIRSITALAPPPVKPRSKPRAKPRAIEAKMRPAPVKIFEVKPQPATAVALDAQPQPVPAVAVETQPRQIVAMDVNTEPEPVIVMSVEAEPEPVAAMEAASQPAPVIAIEAQPEPVVAMDATAEPEPVIAMSVEAESEPVAAMEAASQPAPVIAIEAQLEPVAAMEVASQPAPVIVMEVEAQPEPVVAMDLNAEPESVIAVFADAQLERFAAMEADLRPARSIAMEGEAEPELAFAMDEKMQLELVAAMKAMAQPAPVVAIDANMPPEPAIAKGKPPLGLAQALSGSAADLCAKWG
jgi:general secretion pathway protein A